MNNEHIRSFALEDGFSLRDDGRSIYGRIVPFNVAAHVIERNAQGEIEEYDEAFLPTSFNTMIRHGQDRGNFGWIGLNLDHDEKDRVGYARSVEVKDDGAYAEFKLYKSKDLELHRSMLEESHTGLSVEFMDMADPREVDGVRMRTQVYVKGVAATPQPCYADAGVLAMREDGNAVPQIVTPTLDEINEFLANDKAPSR